MQPSLTPSADAWRCNGLDFCRNTSAGLEHETLPGYQMSAVLERRIIAVGSDALQHGSPLRRDRHCALGHSNDYLLTDTADIECGADRCDGCGTCIHAKRT